MTDYAFCPLDNWLGASPFRSVNGRRQRGISSSFVELHEDGALVATGCGACFAEAIADAMNDLMRRAS